MSIESLLTLYSLASLDPWEALSLAMILESLVSSLDRSGFIILYQSKTRIPKLSSLVSE